MSSRRGIYLDWNATTPPHEDVLAALAAASREAWANPASVHQPGRTARRHIEELREAIAELAGAHPRDVVVTSGGTEANNLALAGARALLTSRIEHPSVTRVAEELAVRGVPVRWLRVGPSGRVDPHDVARDLAELPRPVTVVVMAVNHETGAIQDLEGVFEVVRAAGARLHVDAVQAVGKLTPEFWSRADSITLAAHKLRGPKGIGALVFRGPPSELRPVLRGGGQERGLRPGTQDAALAAGFRAALRRVGELPERHRALGALRDRLEQALADWAQPNVSSSRVPHVSNLWVRGRRADELVAALDLEGIWVSSGSACSAGSSEPSPVLREMFGSARAQESIRVSLGELTSPEEVDTAISVMRRVLSARSSSA